jgi:hypothetical protein
MDKVLLDLMKHRDALLHSAQSFLCSLTEEDVNSFSPEQRDKLKDLAMYAGCTNLSWWDGKVETPER